ncbi:MAG: omega-hydroxy-beta-dihydromenaquinone-9 sulfotransferase [Methyloprofundus sp.]|nr:MAG: omega-hydroxy-beta-dihydromenaquinone-9 sulfotransferase [Methyloprofundus sp.]
MFFLYWPIFLKLMLRMFSRRYFRPKFVFFVGGIIIPSILLLRIIVLFFQILDYVFFPSFWRTNAKQPLFILSNPRSGSTFLHRMLEKDQQFTYLTLWQSLFNSILLYKLVILITNIDKQIGGPLTWAMEKIDGHFFKGWDGLHKAGLRYSEEDEFLFVSAFLAPGLVLFFPYLHEVSDIYSIDNLPEKARKKIVNNFRLSVQRHIYATGGATFLAKNAVAGGRLGIYQEAFPDMRAIYIHSDILKSVASSLSVFTKPWSFHSPDCFQRKYESMSVVEMVRTNYQGIIHHQQKFNPENVIDIEYDDLVTEPEATVKSIYRYFDLSLSDQYQKRLTEDCIAAKSYKSTHMYAVEDYGFSSEEIERYMYGHVTKYEVFGIPQVKPLN